MPTPEERLAELGLSVPEVPTPVATYVPAVRVGSLVYTAGQLPMLDGALMATGKVGDGVTAEQATACAQQCALNAIAAIRSVAGDLTHVRIVKVVAFVASNPNFSGQPGVANGASDLLRLGLRRRRRARPVSRRRAGAAARRTRRGRGHRGDRRLRIPVPPVPLPAEFVDIIREYDDGTRTAADPRNAATVVLLRPGADDAPEVYLLRRQVSMDFAGGMCVFPGGGVDQRDFDPELALAVAWAGPTPAAWADRLGTDEDVARALVCAAVRETFEESGVLLAGDSADTIVADTTGEDWEADRVALETRELSMTDFLNRRGLVLRTDLLGTWGGWLTPVFEPKRYRTWFFVARLPEGQLTRDVSSESSEVVWLPAAEAADEADGGTLAMLPPTYLTCLEVGSLGTVDAVVEAAAGRTVEMFTPTVEAAGDGWTLSMPDALRPLVAARRS